MHSISVLGKEAKSWFYIEYSIYTNLLVLLIRAVNYSETTRVMWRIKSNLIRTWQQWAYSLYSLPYNYFV